MNMKFDLFNLIVVILTGIVGLGLFLIPVPILALYGVDLSQNIPGQFLARFCGSAFLGFAVQWWMGRNPKSELKWRNACLFGGFVTCLLGLIVSVWGGFVGLANFLIWINVIIYIFLTVSFGYFYFLKYK